ncbi:MAG TPA: hypothetical protein VIK86_10365 [Candidatus Paceibacterota bacterium]
MKKFENLKELIELRSIQKRANKKLLELMQKNERSIMLHKIELPAKILIAEFDSEETAKEFGFSTFLEREETLEIQSVKFIIDLRLEQKSGSSAFLAELLIEFQSDSYSFQIETEYGITDKRINSNYSSISEIGLERIILFQKEEDCLSLKKQIEEVLPSIQEIFKVVNNNYYS